ncbi:MAG: DUF2190 family protein [Desulfovibrionaceae bacterium]|nr:DUF2190 family protein [Desulfovibrionaceae bacterium]
MARKSKNPAPAVAEAITSEDDMQNSVRQGRSIDYTPTDDVKGGDLVVFPAMVAVASTDIPAGALGACEAEGVFELPKDSTALAQGQAVFVAANGASVTATAGEGALRAGVAWSEAAGSADVVAVKINA